MICACLFVTGRHGRLFVPLQAPCSLQISSSGRRQTHTKLTHCHIQGISGITRETVTVWAAKTLSNSCLWGSNTGEASGKARHLGIRRWSANAHGPARRHHEGIKPTECASIHHISFYITHHYTIINVFFTQFSSNSEDLRPVKLSMALWCRSDSEEQTLFLWQSSCQGRCPLTQRVRWGAQWYSHTCYGLLYGSRALVLPGVWDRPTWATEWLWVTGSTPKTPSPSYSILNLMRYANMNRYDMAK